MRNIIVFPVSTKIL